MKNATLKIAVAIGLLVVVLSPTASIAQNTVPAQAFESATPVQAGNVVLPSGAAVPPGTLPPGAVPGQQPGAKPGKEKKGQEKDKGANKKPAQPLVIKRGSEPNEAELASSEAILRRTPTGKVSFSFVGAKWPRVMEVISRESNMQLAWQELPGDYLNLVTRQEYAIEDARNIVNRYLLDRGFTMLAEGEILHVVKLDKLNKATVPRVSPEQLDKLPDNEFVKVSFKLNWLVAQEAVAELSSYKSKYGSLIHLATTNRIEAIDTVRNLRDIRNMLESEQSQEGQEKLVKVFKLKHRRASEIIDLVRELMNIDAKPKTGRSSSGGGMNMQMMQMMQRQMQQMAQMAQQNKGKGGSIPDQVSLVLNQRENSILAKAPPRKMAEIEQAVMKLDVEKDQANSLLANINKYKIYRLETIEPQPIVDMLNELGDLSPESQLRVDEDQGAIIAYASLADHMQITKLVEQLDGASRHFEVLQLRRLDADFVAGSIRFLMGMDSEDDKKSSGGGYFYGWGGGYGSQQKDDKSNEFRVDADVVNNRLLLFASDMELEQIEELLVKLGEIPAKDSRESRRRLIDIDPETDPEKFLKRIQQLWPKENKINIAPIPENLKKKPEPKKEPESKEKKGSNPSGKSNKDSNEEPDPPAQPTEEAITSLSDEETKFFLALVQKTEDEQQPKEASPQSPEELPAQQQELKDLFEKIGQSNSPQTPTGSPPPVNIGFTPSGRLMITCDDPAVLNDMEEILLPFTKSRQKHVIYTLKYASPGWTAATLREYFEDEEDSEPVLDWWGDVVQSKKSNGRLSSRSVPRFISDSYSSTILVKGADARQLKTIEDLIKLYDTPEPNDSRSVRVTEMFAIKFSSAEVIATVIKDVYRDLLSSNDKALEKSEKGASQKEVTYIRSGNDDDENETPISFKGLLSVGVDDISNTLIVSSSSGLMQNIREMVTRLDTAAAPSSRVRVIKIDPKISSELVKQRLSKVLKAPKVTSRKTPKNDQPQPGQPAVKN